MGVKLAFTYGPLVYITSTDDEQSGNYYWPGTPPVGYDDIGIPIDADGNQCLPGESILHLNHVPTETEYCEVIKDDLPTIASCRQWFDDNFLVVTDWQICKWIFKWYWWNHRYNIPFQELQARAGSVEAMMREIWPDVQKS